VYRGGQRGRLYRRVVLPVPPPLQVHRERRGDLPGVRVEAGPRRQPGRRDQYRALDVEPRERRLFAGEPLGRGTGPGRGYRDRVARREQQQGGGTRGVQVVVEHPVGGRVPLVTVARVLGGVRPQQVVYHVPARGVLAQQVRGGQLAQRVPGRAAVGGGE